MNAASFWHVALTYVLPVMVFNLALAWLLSFASAFRSQAAVYLARSRRDGEARAVARDAHPEIPPPKPPLDRLH